LSCSYYQFILKLGMQPGPDWETRWLKWKEENVSSTTPFFPPRQAPHRDDSSITTASQSPPPPPSYDESYQSESPSEFIVDPQTASGDDLNGYPISHSHARQPQPFLPLQHQLWTPSQASISPPLQTSTPLASRQPHHRPQSAVQSVHSDASSAHSFQARHAPPAHLYTPTPLRPSPPIPFLQPEPLLHNNDTRRPPQHQPHVADPAPVHALPKIAKQISQSRALIEEELRREDEEKELRKEDERRADHFYSLGLTGRCWDVWRRGREWVLVRPLTLTNAGSL
jgi:hypothetical protein